MDYCRLTIENQKVLEQKAKSKKNGVYTLRGVYYRVRENKITHYACSGEIIEPYGYFNITVGQYDTSLRVNAKLALLSI